MLIERISPFTGLTNHMELDVTKQQLEEWANGKLAQDAFPNLTPGQREFIISGITPKEWKDTFDDIGESEYE